MLPAWDVAAGLTASTGLLAAERHRRRTGQGQLVSLALSDVAYAAVGGFSMDWNFATRTGEADITNLDGRDYTASALAAPLTNPRDFAGTFTQSSGPGAAAGPISGSFFTDGTDPARDVGGQFAVDDRSANYTAVGSFAATKN